MKRASGPLPLPCSTSLLSFVGNLLKKALKGRAVEAGNKKDDISPNQYLFKQELE